MRERIWRAETIFRFLFSPFGRISRRSFWLLYLIPYNIVGTIVFVLLLGKSDLEDTGDITLFVTFEFIASWILIAVFARRLHDLGFFGWPVLAVILAGFGLMEIGWIFGGGDWRETHIEVEKLTGFPFWISLVGVLFAGGAGGIAILFAMFKAGQKGNNQFGPDPLEGRI